MLCKDESEVRDRVRRIETRLTILAQALGVDVVGRASIIWDEATNSIQVSTPNCSLAEVLRVVPQHIRGVDVDVYVGREFITTLSTDPQKPQANAPQQRRRDAARYVKH